MKVLMLHNHYKISAGEDVSTRAEVAMLRRNAVEVDTYYVSNEDIGPGTNRMKLALNTIWSGHHYKEVLRRIRGGRYDILHVQNFFPLLSPSIFYASKRENVRVVMSVRNYRLICPNGLLYVNGSLCRDCRGKIFPFPAVRKKCYRDDLAASSTVVAMLTFHNFLRTWSDKLDGLICVSKFVRDQLLSAGFDNDQLHVKYNLISTGLSPKFEPGDYYIYAGRLSEEKGIGILLETFERNGKKLVIIGNGPLRERVVYGAGQNSHIQYLGSRTHEETLQAISQARALIFPSKWHEPFGRTIIEAFAHGTPVIGSSLGGITELVKNNYNGILFNPYLPAGLPEAILAFERAPDAGEMRRNAYKTYFEEFLPERNFENLLSIYQKVLSK